MNLRHSALSSRGQFLPGSWAAGLRRVTSQDKSLASLETRFSHRSMPTGSLYGSGRGP